MKVYTGKRVFDRETTTHGEPFVVVEKVVDGEPSDRHPLSHVPYHSPDGFEWGYAGSGPADLALSIVADYFEEELTEFPETEVRLLAASRKETLRRLAVTLLGLSDESLNAVLNVACRMRCLEGLPTE